MADWLLEQRTVSSRVQATAREAFEAHKKIFKAIAARDSLAAMEAMQEHLNAVQQRENIDKRRILVFGDSNAWG